MVKLTIHLFFSLIICFLSGSFAAAHGGGGTCQGMAITLPQSCSESPTYSQAMGRESYFNALQGDINRMGGGEAVEDGIQNTNTGRTAVNQSVQECTQAASQCKQRCADEVNFHTQQGDMYASNPETQALAQQHYDTAKKREEDRQKCIEEEQKAVAALNTFDMQLADILGMLLQLAQLFGLGGDGESSDKMVKAEEKSDDPCEGEYADLLIECKGQSDPKGTRGGLNGLAGINGQGGQTGGLLTDGMISGEPGGNSKGNDSGNNQGFPFGGNGGLGAFGAAGMGGFGPESGVGTGVGNNGEGINSDIHKGYMGGGGGGGFSGGGSGASAGRPAFSQFAGGSGNSASKAALNKKLNKVAQSSSRSPASTKGEAGGPFDDMWIVVKKAYKDNSNTMFHQK